MMIRPLVRFSLLAALLLGAGQAQAAAPLLQEGKKTLYQRVLTTPSCRLFSSATDQQGKPVPAFSRFYIYQRTEQAGAERLQVGPDSQGKTVGWLDKACTVDWKMQLTLAFTNPANRDRMLFFQERTLLEKVLDTPDPATLVAPIRQALRKDAQAEGVLAQEPEYFVDVQEQFYLLPVLSGEEVMTENGFRTRLLNVASVSKQTADQNEPDAAKNEPQPDQDALRTSQIKGFSAAVVFVIDSTISMDPYIERTREAVRKVYSKVEEQGLSEQVKFGLIAFRSNLDAAPGIEYLTRMYADPNTVTSSEDFLAKVADLKQAKVSTVAYDEDAYAGVLEALDKVNWNDFGARYVVLITDAGALEGNNTYSSTGLDAPQLRIEAAKPGVAIYTLHLKTPSGKNNHAKAEDQYRELSTYGGTQTSLYYPVNAGDVNQFGKMVDNLATALTEQVKVAYQGGDAIGSAARAEETGDSTTDQMLSDAELIGHAMRLAYLGKTTGTTAPEVFHAWISDRDLVRQNIPTTDVRVLLTKAQLSDLSAVVKQILEAANEGMISPTDMFNRLRSVAAAMGADPSTLKQEKGTKLAELGLMSEYLDDLPYQSAVLSLDEDTWSSWDALSQEKFIRDLGIKLRHYERYNADADRWVSLAEGADARDDVYPVPLEMMP
ncbi:serine/threonine protein kinase PpkA [Alcaligenes faecalis subsp. faecalis NCIB 8687]|jgi:serine/threonine-protein kinase PpkA|uniref:vWA domain-containing protein n=1 Tax=Alcaligenes sp. Lyrl_28 TaxID=3110924 RepID=UPI000269E39C|nr:serine/threonine protein kinase PpkA [Alcaligenes faecalis subsp. faecalis NCIB 8687]